MEKTLSPKEGNDRWRGISGWVLAGIGLLVVAYFTGPYLLDGLRAPIQLVIYAFSTQEEAFTQGIFPAFEQTWAEANDGGLTIEAVFGPSGTLAGQINLGAPADLVLFSNQQHIDWLKLGKRVQKDSEPVVMATTPLVIVTRPGNPLGIAGFADLAKPGIHLLHADPRSSGVGEWAILAEYGSAYVQAGDRAAAEAQLTGIWRNVVLLSPSARATMTLFELGAGDALITYEQDALLAQARGTPLEIVLPADTILARHYAVIVDDNITRTERQAADSLLAFIVSAEGQRILRQYYFRPANLEAADAPEFRNLFTVEDLGGWSQAYAALIDEIWKVEIEPTLDLESATALIERGE